MARTRRLVWYLPALLLLISVAPMEGGGGGVDEGHRLDAERMFEVGLRLEALGRDVDAERAFAAAARLDPSPQAYRISLHRASGLFSYDRASPHYRESQPALWEPPLRVLKVLTGLCSVLADSDSASAVGEMWGGDDLEETSPVHNTEEEVPESVLFGCENPGLPPTTHWHIVVVSLSNASPEQRGFFSWITGGDLFSIAKGFARNVARKYNTPFDEELVRYVWSYMARRNAAMQNQTIARSRAPPWSVPDDLLHEFTMGGRIEVGRRYFDESSADARTNYMHGMYSNTRQEIDRMVNAAKREQTGYYASLDVNLYPAIKNIGGLQGKHVVVMGSLLPWYEAVCLAFGAASITTLEYNELSFDHPSLRTMTVAEYDSLVEKPKFDIALSMSSFEHDGLGRYGDPIDPAGDLKAMKRAKDALKPDGLLLLAVPCGKDLLLWNAHRKYGRLRLPLLFQGWSIEGRFGLTQEILDDPNQDAHEQPVWILRNGQAGDGDSRIDWDKILGMTTTSWIHE